MKRFLAYFKVLFTLTFFMAVGCTYGTPDNGDETDDESDITETNTAAAIYGLITNQVFPLWKVKGKSLSSGIEYYADNTPTVGGYLFRLLAPTNDNYSIIGFVDLNGNNSNETSEWNSGILINGYTNVFFGTNSVSNIVINVALPGQAVYTNGVFRSVSGYIILTNADGDTNPDIPVYHRVASSNSGGTFYAVMGSNGYYRFFLQDDTYDLFSFYDNTPDNRLYESAETNLAGTNNLTVTQTISNLNLIYGSSN